MVETSGTAVIVGVGAGLGAALARRFANARMNVALAARTRAHVQPFAKEINNYATIKARAYGCDATKAKDVDIAEIGTRLKVGTVLEGSVRQAGHQLRVTARLIDVRHGARL